MRVIIAAGGTGGHLYPGVALAREFQRQASPVEIIFVGTKRGLESKVVPEQGFELITIFARGIMGKGWLGGLHGLAVIPAGLMQCLALCRSRRPDLVIGIGGYTSPPVIAAAWLLGIKRVLLEPNAYPGMANRLVAPLANLVFVAFADAVSFFGNMKTRVVGTPIRREFLEGIQQGRHPGTYSAAPVILVLGGSQGARSINRAMAAAFPVLATALPGLRVIHQTGERDFEATQQAYAASMQAVEAHVNAPEVVPFLFDVPRAMTGTDLVVSRSGATTVAEITACGKPAILIPFPHAIHGHQERNARVLEQAGAAHLILDQQLTVEGLAEIIQQLFKNPERLQDMQQHSRGLGRTNSAEQVVAACRSLVGQG